MNPGTTSPDSHTAGIGTICITTVTREICSQGISAGQGIRHREVEYVLTIGEI